MFFDQPIECLVNGYAGQEYLIENKKSGPAKHLLVIGAGPAGCEFAIRAAERGHSVTLWEQNDTIGGQLKLVSVPPSKHEFNNLSAYYTTMLKKTGVEVLLGKTATVESVQSAGFDAIIFATGVTTNSISLPGESTIPICTANDILAGTVMAGRNVVMIGGGSVGCETAAYLAHEGSISENQLYFMMSQQSESQDKITGMVNSTRRNISIVDIAKIGAGFDPGCGWPVLNDLKRIGVKQYPFTQVVYVTNQSMIIDTTNKKTGEVRRIELPCDTIVLAVGSKSDAKLYDALKDGPMPVYNIGDSAQVGKIISAIRQADELALEF